MLEVTIKSYAKFNVIHQITQRFPSTILRVNPFQPMISQLSCCISTQT